LCDALGQEQPPTIERDDNSFRLQTMVTARFRFGAD
jgi:hypothetical protein